MNEFWALRSLISLLETAALLGRTTNRDDAISCTRNSAAHQDQPFVQHEFYDWLRQDRYLFIAALARHFFPRKCPPGCHVATDRTTVPLVFVGAVSSHVSAEIVPAHYTREATTATDTSDVNKLSFLKNFLNLNLLTQFKSRDEIRVAAKLFQ